MNRKPIKNRVKDSRIFRHTASRVNTVNIAQMVARGGTRL